MKALLCLMSGHRWGSWRLTVARFGLGVVKDATTRRCACCRRSEFLVLPFR